VSWDTGRSWRFLPFFQFVLITLILTQQQLARPELQGVNAVRVLRLAWAARRLLMAGAAKKIFIRIP